MYKNELIRRYIIFVLSVVVIAFGLCAIVRSDLGTSPISSTPYVFSLNTPLTIGTWLFILCVIFILVQMLFLTKAEIREKRIVLLSQIPISFVFGFFTDLAMWILSDLNPETYYAKVVTLVVGCFVLALGICLEVIADVMMMGGEYTVQVAAKRFKIDFGTVKIIFDVTLIILAIICSLLFASKVEGIREGTVITALITGPFVKLIMPYLSFVRQWQSCNSIKLELENQPIDNSILITISREYGSGGHEIGEMIAAKLNIPFYDNNLIDMVAKEGGFTTEFVSEKEQSIHNPLLYNMLMYDYEAPLEKSISPEDVLFVTESRVIRSIAEQGSCVIVGRCANFILNKYKSCINIFVHADIDCRVDRVVSNYGIDRSKAIDEINRIDMARRGHYKFYTGKRWGDSNNYHLTCDSSLLSIDDISTMVENVYLTLKKESDQK